MKKLLARGLTFVVRNPIEAWRVQTLEEKEPGTIRWIEDTVQSGDVFYDVGANIGVYTLLAAQRVGNAGHVYAFEPHVANAATLLLNIAANHFSKRVTVLTVALGDSVQMASVDMGLSLFHYRELTSGSSGSQCGHTTGEDGQSFQPVVTELKAVTTLAYLSESGLIRPPTVVKIDVDGNELQILRGMNFSYPKSIQVESHPNDRAAIHEWVCLHGWQPVLQHFTANGQQQLDQGAHPDMVVCNAIFERQPVRVTA